MTVFRKLGVRPWIAWIPIYGTRVWFEIGELPGWLSPLTLASPGGIVSSVFLDIGMNRTGLAFRKVAGFLVLRIFRPRGWMPILGSRDSTSQPTLVALSSSPPLRARFGARWPNWAN